MARIRLASILASAKGKFGSAVLYEDKHGSAIMREKGEVSNPQTARQTGVRGALKASSKAYKVMPQIDAAAWGRWGLAQKDKNGDPLDPIAAYNRLAIKYRIVHPGGTAPLTPPATEFVGPDLEIDVAAGSGGKLTFSAESAAPAGVLLETLVQPLDGANRKPTLKGYETAAYGILTLGASGNYEMSVGVAPGLWACAYRWVQSADGQQTDLVPIGTATVALAVVQGGADETAPAKRARRKAA